MPDQFLFAGIDLSTEIFIDPVVVDSNNVKPELGI
jgi:hypothetical protein